VGTSWSEELSFYEVEFRISQYISPGDGLTTTFLLVIMTD